MDLGFEGDFIVQKDSVDEVRHAEYIARKVGRDHVLLQSTPFKTVFANDILEDAKKVWVDYFTRKGYSEEIYHVESIVDLVKRHRLGETIFPDQVDVVTGGFPCQDFSVSGKRKGFDSHKDHQGRIIQEEIPSIETRGQLYMWMKEVIEITKPKIFIAENVKGLVNLSNVKEIIQKDFSKVDGHGYLVLEPQVLHAANYGVPQSRERVLFIGLKKSALRPAALKALSKPTIPEEHNPYPQPTHSFTVHDVHLKKPIALASIFKNLPEPVDAEDSSQRYYSKAKYMGAHCQGQTEVNLQGIGPTIRSEHHGNIEYRRLSPEHGGKNHKEVVQQGLPERRLTPRECGLIQTFPTDFRFVIPAKERRFEVSPSMAYKLIGNAVPPLLAFHLAMRIEEIWGRLFHGR